MQAGGSRRVGDADADVVEGEALVPRVVHVDDGQRIVPEPVPVLAGVGARHDAVAAGFEVYRDGGVSGARLRG